MPLSNFLFSSVALGGHTQKLPILVESQKDSCLLARLLATEKQKQKQKKRKPFALRNVLGFDTYLYNK